MEEYLRKCLNSLIVSDENMKRLEVLVINDGSKDSSSQIGHEFESKYPQTFRIIDKDNGNYGSCINRGLKEATGTYVQVLDADDNFNTDEFNKYLNQISLLDVDLILSDYVEEDLNGNVLKERNFGLYYNRQIDFEEIASLKEFSELQMHAVTYRLSLLKNNSYSQSEGISYTDQEWMFRPMYYVHSVFVCDCVVYRYLIGREGQTMSPDIMIKCISHTKQGLLKMVDAYSNMAFETDGVKSYFRKRLQRRLDYVYLNYIVKYPKSLNAKDLLDFDMEIKNRSLEIYNMADNLSLFYGRLKYVSIWRSNSNSFLLSIIKTIYNCYSYFK